MKNIVNYIFLWPLSLIYGAAIYTRDILYEAGLLRSVDFSVPVINIGNLSVGGAGKTPHVDFIAIHLKKYLDIAILSRGYKRKNKGFKFVNPKHNALQIGDEPLQFKRKHADIVVAVSESRALGIPAILKKFPQVKTILLDDAYQHRSVKAGLNILLTPVYNLFVDDQLIPLGRLREDPSAAKRADIIVVTKCDPNISEEDRIAITSKLNINANQSLFFSKYRYYPLYNLFNPLEKRDITENHQIILISAIANTSYLMDYLYTKVDQINALNYEDHHYFTDQDMNYIKKIYENADPQNRIIITTEKDSVRLEMHRHFIIEHNLSIFVLPIEVEFLDGNNKFLEKIEEFLLDYKV